MGRLAKQHAAHREWAEKVRSFTREHGMDAAMRVLELAIVCDEECGRAGAAPSTFAACFPTALVSDSERLYRAHVREMCERDARGDDLRPGTLAEVLGALSKASLEAPLDACGAALYEHVFERLFPDDVPEGRRALEQWEGQVAESLAHARRILATERRP